MKLLRRCLFFCFRLFSLSTDVLHLLHLLLIPETQFSKHKQKKIQTFMENSFNQLHLPKKEAKSESRERERDITRTTSSSFTTSKK